MKHEMRILVWYCDKQDCGKGARTESVVGSFVNLPKGWVSASIDHTERHFCSDEHAREAWNDQLVVSGGPL